MAQNLGVAGFWGEFSEFVDRHDEILMNPVDYAAAVAPVFTMDFQNYRVPGGMTLILRTLTVCSPWESFSAASMQAVLSSENAVKRGVVDYGAPVAPVPHRQNVLATLDAPGTITRLSVPIMSNQCPVVRVSGVPFPEYSGTGGGGVSVHFTGELVKA